MPELTIIEQIEAIFEMYPGIQVSVPMWQIKQMNLKSQAAILEAMQDVTKPENQS